MLALSAPLITLAQATCKVNGQVVPCPDIGSMIPGGVGAGLFGLFSIIFPLLWLLMMVIGIGGTIFWIFMLIHAAQHDIKDKTTWILVVALTSFIGATIYYFMVKKPFDAAMKANGGQMPQYSPIPTPVSTQTPGVPVPQPIVAPVATKSSAFSITALVLGIAAFIPGVGFICGIVGIVFGFIARSQIKKGIAEGKGMALAGIILGFAGIIMWIIIGLLPLILFMTIAASSR